MKKDLFIIWLNILFTQAFGQRFKPFFTTPDPDEFVTTPPPSQPGFFSVVGSRILRGGEVYRCTVTSFNYPGTLKLLLAIQGNQTSDGKFARIEREISRAPGESAIEEFDADTLLPGNYELIATALNKNFKFSRAKYLYYQPKNFSVLIQTDKPIYKPDDLLRFRVFVLDSTTRPYKSNGISKVSLLDPSGNLVNEWQNISYPNGTFESQFQLSGAVVGEWNIKANIETQVITKTIKVDQYVLPKFQVELIIPQHVLQSNEKIPVTIKASYTYGKPLNGHATLSCRNFELKNIAVNGETSFQVDIVTDIGIEEFWYDQELTFLVTLEDSLTKKTMTAKASTTLHSKPWDITMSSQTGYEFLPGNTYMYTLSVKSFDGTPAVPYSSMYVRVNFDYNSIGKLSKLLLDNKGQARLTTTIPSNATVLVLEAYYEDVTQSFYVYKSFSNTESLAIKVLTREPALYDEVWIEVNLNENVPFVIASIFSKGILVRHKKVLVQDRTATFSFIPKFSFAPESTVVVYFIKEDGTCVSESTKITFRKALPNYLTMKLSNTTVAPGENLTLDVFTVRTSVVYFLAIDKSVLLMNSGNENDLTKNILFDDLNLYNEMLYAFDDANDRDNDWYYVVDNFENKFTYVNTLIITNAVNKFEKQNYDWFRLNRKNNDGSDMAIPDSPIAPVSKDGNLAPTTPAVPVRKDFSETFLWDSIFISTIDGFRPKGRGNITAKVPDTLTSWVISAVSLNKHFGIGLLDEKPSITVFMPFFIQLNLPYSVKRGEKLILEIFIRNYLGSKQIADVTFGKNDAEFSVVNSNGWKDGGSEFTQRISIENDVSVLTISIVPKILGLVTLKVKAVSAMAGDAIEEKLRVVPEGIPQSISNASFLQKTSSDKIKFDLSCTLPENAVQDTVSVEGLIVGNVIGNALDNLGELIQMPYGCGEQNLLNFVPNIVIYTYLQSSNQLTQEIKDKIVSFTQQGYQRQLNYRRSADGSFSGFGDSDASGSTWLTAYTLKAFVWAQNNNIITVDSNVISRALDFILAQQNPDGSFNEPGRVIHVDMQGESGSGVALTAYLAIVLTELLSIRPDLNTNLQNALNYIVAHVDTSDVYMLAISSYALELNSHPQKASIINAFVSKAIESSSEIHWEKVVAVDPNGPWWYYQPRSVDIEITAYGLLLYLKNSNLKGKSIKVVKWLISKRNEFGGYSSSQDTVVGIEAISKFAALSSSAASNLNIILQPNMGQSLKTVVNKNNQMLVQKFLLPSTVRSMTVTASGTGFAVVQLVCNFYLVEAESFPRFNVEIDFEGSCKNSLSIEICVSFIPDKLTDTSSMVLVLLDLPSGYVADQPDEIMNSRVKKIELKNGGTTVHIYMDSLGAKKRCFNLNAERQAIVENPKNSSIEVRDYYDSTKKASVPYVLPQLPPCQ